MSDDLESALVRLKRLSSVGDSMSVPDIVEAVVGLDHDKELEDLVRTAFEAATEPLKLEDMATGILAIQDWRKKES